ncbi:MAG TPA: LptF/LptG family permease [Opitutaceae bacterium]|nr:LptF/LptG family permease [Opitutaceae bacterium]
MKLIHRHIFWNVVLSCAGSVGLFVFILMVANVLKDLLGYVLAGQIGVESFVILVALLLPYAITYALPMGILTGVLLVLGRMSSDREITAIRASGVSVAGVSAPIFFFALLGTGAALAVNFQFMPLSRTLYEREKAQVVRQDPLSLIVPKTFIRDFRGLVVNVGAKDGARLRDIWVWELDAEKRVTRAARAELGEITYDEPGNKLVLRLENLLVEQRDDKDPENFMNVRGAAAMQEATFDLPLDRVMGAATVRTKLKFKTFSELMAEWRRLEKRDPAVPDAERKRQQMRVQVTIHEKFATAFAVLSFAVIAIPLGIKVSRKETSANLGVALLLVFGYYLGTMFAGLADARPELRPDLLMWLPNLGFQALGAWMFYKVDRQ